MKVIKLVVVGNYACAVKLGHCPMFAIEQKDKLDDLVIGLREDFPDYRLVQGGKKERAEAAKRIIMQKNMNAGR